MAARPIAMVTNPSIGCLATTARTNPTAVTSGTAITPYAVFCPEKYARSARRPFSADASRPNPGPEYPIALLWKAPTNAPPATPLAIRPPNQSGERTSRKATTAMMTAVMAQ